ncbi:PREDICTED: cell wall protein DAN4-like [Rhagoletis zephyria]|uniref:cell wall protein DAN4-like n=1 Tax=Rhagoletis zephyria TaxID=28612 RepID=UPI00081185F1|nr:PREDICTED: cell wall protein DAN4-like [Rhagoletis zephyria]
MGEARRKYNEKHTHTQKPQISYANITNPTLNKPSTKTTPNTSTSTSATYKRPASPTKANITKIAKTQTHINKLITDNDSTTNKTSTQITQFTNENVNSNKKNLPTTNPSHEDSHTHSSQTQITSQTNTTSSPLSQITQQLLNESSYFMSVSDSEEEPKL